MILLNRLYFNDIDCEVVDCYMNKFFNNMKKYHKYAVRSAKAELKSEVADSRLNWLWWVIEPLCFMLVYTLVFGVIFQSKETHFSVFVMFGLTLWDFFNRMISGSVKLIINNRDLVTKVYLPKYILLYSKSLTYLFKMCISFALTFLLMICVGAPLTWHIIFLIPVLFVVYVVSFGLGMILMHFGVTFDDLANLTNIGLRMLFYLTGVFFNIKKRIGGHLGFIMLRLNPIACLINEARKVGFYGTLPSFKLLAFWLVIGIIICAIGVHLIHKNENSYAKVI